MGTRRTGDGGDWFPNGDHSPEEPPGVPGLPPEWGRVVIPDDASALAAEAEQVRQELTSDRKRFPIPGRPGVGVPLLIMSVAVFITLVSLFIMAWAGSTVPQRTVPSPAPMPAVTLTEVGGGQVATDTLGPAVVLLVEDCDCSGLIRDTHAAAPSGVAVVVVDRVAPRGDPPPDGVRWLLDPDGALRSAVGLSPPTGAAAAVLLLDQEQTVTLTTRTTSVRTFQPALERLQPR